jgi:hypothetical protein
MRSVGIKVFVAIICALLLTSHTPAMAHTALVSSSPRNGAVLQASPKNFVLRFSESLAQIDGKQINTMKVMGPSKVRVQLNSMKIMKSSLSTTPLQPLTIGRYEISYRVVAKDGHTLTGKVNFSVR